MEEKEFLFKIETKTLIDVVKSVKEITTEARFNLNRKGLRITELDPSNVCLVDLNIDKGEFYELTDREEVKEYGLNFEDFYKKLKENKKHEVEVKQKEDKLYLNFSNGLNSEITLIDVGQEKKDIPEIETSTEIKINTKRLKEVLKHFCSNSDSVIFENNEKEFKIFSEEGDNISLNDVEIKGENSRSKYSTEYLKKFIKNDFSEDTYLKFYTEYPLVFEQKTDTIKLNYYLAPRIENTE